MSGYVHMPARLDAHHVVGVWCFIEVHRRVTPEAESHYPARYKSDSAEFPEAIADIEDESEVFVLDIESNEWAPADEFFAQMYVTEFAAVEYSEDHPDFRWPR